MTLSPVVGSMSAVMALTEAYEMTTQLLGIQGGIHEQWRSCLTPFQHNFCHILGYFTCVFDSPIILLPTDTSRLQIIVLQYNIQWNPLNSYAALSTKNRTNNEQLCGKFILCCNMLNRKWQKVEPISGLNRYPVIRWTIKRIPLYT